jgi:hypothetical protein
LADSLEQRIEETQETVFEIASDNDGVEDHSSTSRDASKRKKKKKKKNETEEVSRRSRRQSNSYSAVDIIGHQEPEASSDVENQPPVEASSPVALDNFLVSEASFFELHF